MKIKFYTSLLIGVGLAFVATSSYAKSTASAHKKHVSPTAKTSKTNKTPSSKKHSVLAVKHSVPHSHTHKPHQMVSHVKTRHKAHDGHDGHHAHHGHHAKKYLASRHRTPKTELDYLDTEQPALVTIPHLPSQNQFITTEAEPTETNNRIHSFIPNGRQTEFADRSSIDDSPHNYTTTHGIITTSLADAGEEAGLSEELINQLIHIFAWDIDFATNLHVGDEFTVLYESDSMDEAHIVAAEFVTEGRVLTAVRYEDSDGNVNYYTPEGKAMRKAFLSTPVDYARITSHFSANRRHPILNRIRAHKGVDYAARIGTPVKAAGDGTITFMGRKGGYGQVVIIQHGEHFETLYAHLSNFKHTLLEGDTINQGDIIGYVGQTGLATGPHLHYEFRVDGVHKNPETAMAGGDSRNAMALDYGSLQDFKRQTRTVVAKLYSAKAQSLFAKNQQAPR